jgi:hypothetical protein
MFGRITPAELHTWVDERLSDYIDNQLAPDERTRLEKHLTECARCRTNLDAMRWSLTLLKQAPVPATRRSFALSVPATAPHAQPTFAFAFARLATVVAALALVAVIGIDLFARYNAVPAPVPMMAPMAAEKSNAPTSVAIAPVPTAAPPPTSAPRAASASSAPASSEAPVAPAPGLAAPTPSLPATGLGGAPPSTASDAAKAQTSSARQPSSVATATSSATPTVTPTPPATPSPVPPTETPAPTVVAQVRETATPLPLLSTNENTPAVFSPVRLVEIGLLFVAIFFATLTFLLWRQRS